VDTTLFALLMANPMTYVLISTGINLFSNFIEKVKTNNENNKTVEKIIEKSVKSAALCVEPYMQYEDVTDNIIDRLKIVLFKDYNCRKLDDIILLAINLSIEEIGYDHIRNQKELCDAFIYFFMESVRKNETLSNLMSKNLIFSIYGQAIELNQTINNNHEIIIETLDKIHNEINQKMNASVSLINNEIYQNFISLNNNDKLLMSNRLIFNEIIDYYNDSLTDNWKANIIKLLVDFKRIENEIIKYEIDKVVKKIENPLTFDRMVILIKNLLPKLIEKNQVQLGKLLQASYNKILIISGEPGSGKTEFINYMINRLSERNTYVIPIDYKLFIEFNNITDIAKQILNHINIILDTKFNSYGDMYVYNKEISQFKIIFAIDDCHKCIVRNINHFQKIINFIIQYAAYDFTYWSLIVNEFDMYIFENELIVNEFISKYTINKRLPKYEDCHLYSYDFNLTKFNILNETGTLILRENNCNNVKILDNKKDITEACFHRINNPFFARMLVNTKADIKDILLKSFFLEFNVSVIEILQNKLKYEYEGIFKDNNFDEEKCLKSIICYIIQTQNNLITENEFKNNIYGIQISTCLRLANLIIYKSEKKETYFMSSEISRKVVTYELYYDFFWAFKLLLTQIDMTSLNLDNQDTIEKLCTILKNDKYKEEVLSYIIFYYDFIQKKQNDVGNNYILNYGGLLDFLDINDALYIAFANVQFLDGKTYKNILKKSKQKKYNLTKKDTYMLLYALNTIKMKNDLKNGLICNYSQYIDHYKMYLNFEDTFDNIIKEYNDTELLLDDIKPLWYCKYDEINKITGRICAEKYYHLIKINNNSNMFAIDQIVKYNIIQRKFLGDIYNDRSYGEHQFWDSFFKQIIFKTISASNIYSVFEYFDGKKLFNIEIENPFPEMYRRVFTRAAGDKISSFRKVFNSDNVKNYKREYILLVNNLYNSGAISNRKFAFHLIKNSLINAEDYEEPLIHELYSALIKIKNTKNMSDFVIKHQEFFDRKH